MWWSQMDIISQEIDSMTPKTPDNIYHTKCFMKTFKMYDVILRSCWNLAYKKGSLRLPERQLS